MQTEKIQQLAINALEDLKAIDLVTFDIRPLTDLADSMVICSGSSNRHVKSLAESVVKAAKENHLSTVRTEGEREGEWIIVDLGDVIVHVMQPATRTFYNLEDLWEPIKELREQHK
jgi:ribosome-associated protein